MKKFLSLAVFSTLLLTACSEKQPTVSTDDSSSSVPESISSNTERVIRETKNVSYSGVVRPLGISIYMEGTHRLTLTDGRFILLESESSDLNGYVGENVDVVGAIRPTVESDAMIMRVESISLTESEEEITEESAESVTSTAEEPVEESTSSYEEDSSETIEEEQPTEEPTETPKQPSPEFLGRVQDMAGEEFTAENWTQEYCSAHIGFCIPVHRNWWYKSFGATSSHYWHLEMNSAPFEDLNNGPLVVNLDGESIEALGIEEGAIRTEGDDVVGYRSWTNGRHFEIRAHSSLKAAVEYISENLRSEG